MNQRRNILTLAALFALGALIFFGQQGAQRMTRDETYLANFTAEPGGTREENLWQVLVLFGAGDREPAAWDGRLAVTSGEVFEVSGYRFEPPDRVLPEGGWRARTKVERVKFGASPGWKNLPQMEPQLVPKGLLIRGAGSAATQLTLETPAGRCAVRPMSMAFGGIERCAGGRVEVRRIPPATDLSGTELRQHDFPSISAGPDGTLWTTWLSYHDRQEELNFRRDKDGRWTRLIPVARAAADLWRPHATTDAG
ncbi:MAG: hypothetical protein HY822_12935, partial [Acidobacteria bacterium]|nr:hypothetical protein [Acidobacteriota bacterium]